MKKLLIRTLSGTAYCILVVFAIYSSQWLGSRMAGSCVFIAFFGFVAMMGVHECYKNLTIKGVETNKAAGYTLALLTYCLISIMGIAHMAFLSMLILPALFAVVFLCQLWRKDEHPFATIGYTLLPIIWVVYPLVLMQPLSNFGAGLLMMVFICTWINDSGAYLTGMAIGKHKMWERHSPNKTWEGTLGGALFCVLGAIFIGPLLQGGLSWWYWAILGLTCSVAGTLGDLVESMFKRFCGVKDSGNIMPGHGGVLDRFDSVIMIIPFILFILCVGSLF
ncbi:MAG: phosphatidate cytidylyltransferase [Bacteroidales bacterium]|nr:phosphatidate cytidylyltransferase [Bacteroidales bacterium]